MPKPPKNPPPSTFVQISMNASNWLLFRDYGSCVGMPPNPTQNNSISWQFEFPKAENDINGIKNKVGYVLQPRTAAILGNSIVGSFQITSSADTLFVDGKEPSDGVTPASFRFLICKDISSNEFGRWWSNPIGLYLDNINNQGIFNLSVPLTPENWTSVYGKTGTEAITEFNLAKNYPIYIGLTFGAGGDFGHGVRTQNGTAYFIATDIKLI